MKVYLEETNKKPKIFVTPIKSGFFEETVKLEIDEKIEVNTEEVVEALEKVEIKDEARPE